MVWRSRARGARPGCRSVFAISMGFGFCLGPLVPCLRLGVMLGLTGMFAGAFLQNSLYGVLTGFWVRGGVIA